MAWITRPLTSILTSSIVSKCTRVSHVRVKIAQFSSACATVAGASNPTRVCDSLEAIIDGVKALARPGTQVVIMSNGGFGGLHGKLAQALA